MKNRAIALRQGALTKAARTVPYLTQEEVYQLARAALKEDRNGGRDSLLVLVLRSRIRGGAEK